MLGPGEKYVDVAVSVRLEQMSVFDVLVSERHPLWTFVVVERLVRQGFRRSWRVDRVLPFNNDFGGHPQSRVFLCDDHRSRLPEGVVRTGLLQVPVSVEEHRYAFGAGASGDFP